MTNEDVVAITGATGAVGRALVPGLREHHRLRLHSRNGDFRAILHSGDETVTGEIEDLESARSIVRGVRTVVHLAAESRANATWEQVLTPNIVGIRSILEAARLERVSRVVFASSNHVTGQYDIARDWPIGTGRALAPDCVYGASKAFGEALAAYYAWAFALSVICLRIGWVLPSPHDEKSRRLWLSHRDLVQLVDRCIRSDVQYGIFYGVSAHVPDRYDLTDAQSQLGYDPQDAFA